jgi:hypothetical protein
VPEFFIQAFGLGRLVLKRLQIHRPRQRRRPAAGLIPLAPWSNAGCSRNASPGATPRGEAQCSTMASVSSRPERKLDLNVAPSASPGGREKAQSHNAGKSGWTRGFPGWLPSSRHKRRRGWTCRSGHRDAELHRGK